jgi:3-hydroxyisobutyrate dehydrogenase-like beta-hydroxyacid dehydrogenase
MTVGFLHPGQMGASLAALCDGPRLWCSRGRSAATHDRAEAAGMEACDSIRELASRSDVIVSVCPPASAVDVADEVAAAGYTGIYVDANAIAPVTARAIGDRFARFVDGAVIGPPAGPGRSTRLILSGADADTVAAHWRATPLETRVVDGGAGAASAGYASYAAWTKGGAALLLAIRALARAEGVEGALLAEWETSQPDLVARSDSTARQNAPKAWRFAGELDEIGDSFVAQGLPGGFGHAAGEVYERLARFKDAADVSLDAVLEALVGEPG